MITDRWRVGDGEMGALINFSYTRLHYLDSIISQRVFRRSLRQRHPLARLAVHRI